MNGVDKRSFLLLFISIITGSIFHACGTSTDSHVFSPDGDIRFHLFVDQKEGNNKLSFSIVYKKDTIISRSPLGFKLADGTLLSESFELMTVMDASQDTTYHLPFGKMSLIRNHFFEKTFHLKHKSGFEISLIVRIYDDGLGFRYFFPENDYTSNILIKEELTGFHFVGDYTYWGLHLNSYTTSYEETYTTDVLSGIPPETLIGLPMLVKISEKVWVGITEAALVDYAGLYLKPSGEGSTCLVASLSPLLDGSGIAVKTKKPAVTPWRVLIIEDNPGKLVESNIVLNLNDPPEGDFSWVKPGLAINDWTNDQTITKGGFEGAMDNRTMKYYIDFCRDYGLEYMSIDAGWYSKDYMDTTADLTRPIPEIDIPMLIQYGKERGVDIFLWTLGNVMRRQMDEAMDQFVAWGVRGFNVDFNNRDDQEMVNFINLITKKAAEHQLHVEFHGVYKPTGLCRTYPNLLAHEAVLGLEYAKWDTRPTPEHNCIIPFTRMLAGPMDYIVVGFTNRRKDNYEIIWDQFQTLGTRCHQLAHLVIFESGFQVLADYPDNYRDQMGSELFRKIPGTWDDTKVLNAAVGDYITVARKHESSWLVGSITDWTSRDLSIPLSFLDNGDYIAEIYRDGDDADVHPESVGYLKIPLSSADTLQVHLASGGGHVMHIYPQQ